MGVLVLSLAIVSVYWMSCSSLTSWLLCASFSRSPRNCCREREHRIGVSMRVSRSPLLVKHVHVLYGIVYSQTLPGFPNTWRKHIHDVRNMFKFCDCHLLHLTAEFVCKSLWRNPMFMDPYLISICCPDNKYRIVLSSTNWLLELSVLETVRICCMGTRFTNQNPPDF